MHAMRTSPLRRLAKPTMAFVFSAVVGWAADSSGQRRKPSAPTCSPRIDLTTLERNDPDVTRGNRAIDSTFAALVAGMKAAPPSRRYDQLALLGNILLVDKNLSVNRNVACVTCHAPEAGFTGGVDAINRTIVAYPGSSGGITSARKPQSYGYAAFAPILHYNKAQQALYGGNFWDMRATGASIGNPAAEQAQGPPVNPVEMALPDVACAVYRVWRGPYRSYVERVRGAQAFAIHWPANVEQVCSTPAPPPARDSLPVHLSATDRGIAASTYDGMALSIALFEASPEVSPFSSKFDSALAHPDQQVLSSDEQAGWALFRGKARCNSCHLDGTGSRSGVRSSSGQGQVRISDAADVAPLFTDFTSANIGVPRNPGLRFYCENRPDSTGFIANPAGDAYVDHGVAGFLRSTNNPNPSWTHLAGQLDGAMRVPTIRNVDRRPRPDFVKAYMHNGYLKSLKEVVHFYNTRDALPRCREDGDAGEKVTCWPAPEVAANVDTIIGKLGLTPQEEDQLVAFMKTLTDQPVKAKRRP